jgi:serine/threonine protein kinase/WD40 repeat protein
MYKWSITLHGPSGIISTVDTGESQFVIGKETASDVFTVQGEGVMPRHAWVWISEGGLQAEDLGGGTLVNGYQINERVQVEYPASVQVGEVTLVIEVKTVQPVAVSSTPSSMDITIPQRGVTKSKASMEVTIPQRTPTRSSVQKTASTGTTAAPSTSADEASTHCKYTLVREIARGGMGQIYFGEDPQLKRNVAVKVSSVSEAGEDPRFSKEAEVLAQLAHPNIVPIYNIGVDAQSRPFYSMKLIKGRTLQAVLNLIRDRDAAAIKEYPRATLLTIFRKVCDAMMFAHSKGILHRDLKPENIMVGEYGEVLVMDWGLAKVLGEQENNSAANSRVNDTGDYGMTMEGEVMGTPQYMSPEQAMGMVAELDARSDIYSLGGILYAILTLRPPIDGTTLDEVLTKVKNGSISSMVTKRGGKGEVTVGAPTAMGAEVPEALQAVTLKAMATDRNKRYASVEAFAGDIERYQNGFATQAEEAGAMRQMVLFVKRNKGVSSAVALFLMAVLIFTVRLAASEREARNQMEKSRRAAALAQMTVAEAAESVSDSIALKRALSEVPEDLRTRDWQYFQDRIDTATFEIRAPAGQSWVGFDDWPLDEARMLALRSDGELFAVNVNTGTLQSLWKFNPQGFTSLGPIGVSSDGKSIVLGYKKGNNSCAEVRLLQDGRRIGSFSASASKVSALIVSGGTCVLLGQKITGNEIQVWDAPSGKLLWEMTGVGARFSSDSQNLLVQDHGITAQRRDILSGKILSTGPTGGMGEMQYSAGTADWEKFLTGISQWKRIRSQNPWTGKVQFEVSPRFGNYRCAVIPPGNFFATVGKTSNLGKVLEIRSFSNGEIALSLPFILRGDPRVLRAKAESLALWASDLKIWKLNQSVPQMLLPISTYGARLGKTSRIWKTSKHDGKIWSQIVETSEADPKKRLIQEAPLCELSGSLPRHFASADGERLFSWVDGDWASYRLKSQGLEELWATKSKFSIGRLETWSAAGDRIWTGRLVLDSLTGQVLVSVNDRGGLNGGHGAVWIGSNRVAEVAILDPVNVDVGDPQLGFEHIAMWDTDSGQLLARVEAPNTRCICASPDGAHIAEAGLDKRIRIRDSRTLEVEKEFRAHEDAITGIAWHPNAPLLVTTAKDGVTRIWDLVELKKVEEWFGDPSPEVFRLEITTDGLELNEVRYNQIRVYQPRVFRKQASGKP